jgi:hypothetical protein
VADFFPLPGTPEFRALPIDLQARLEVAVTLGAHVAALQHLVDGIQAVLAVEAPGRAAYGAALRYHVRTLAIYFAEAEAHAAGLTTAERREWKRGNPDG